MRTVYGGNSGYVGYSKSVRATVAESEGKYPKTTFKKVYGLSEKKFKELENRDIISVSEWHHTSVYGNRTNYYSIDDEVLFYAAIGDKEKAYELYLERKNRTAEAINNKPNALYSRYNQTVVLPACGEEYNYLISLGEEGRPTKSGKNCRFGLDKIRLSDKEYRKIFAK